MNVNNIILGDSIEELKKIPDESVDMCFADPPFNIGKKYGNHNDRMSDAEYLEWSGTWLKELVRITKNTGSIFIHNIPKWLISTGNLLTEFGAVFKHWIAWDAQGWPTGRALMPSHYGILYYVKSDNYKFYDVRGYHRRCRNCNIMFKNHGGKKKNLHPFGIVLSDVWTDIFRTRHKVRRDEHPCQLPVHLIERLVLMCTDEGDVVCDPFMGTGTTAIASKKMGRNYLGIDNDEQYVNIANSKLKIIKPFKLNNSYVSIFLNELITIRDIDWDDIKNEFYIPKYPEEEAIKFGKVGMLFDD